MSSIFRALARRRKLLMVVIIGAVVTGYVQWHKWCTLRSAEPLCSSPTSAEFITEVIRIARWYVLGLAGIIWLFIYRERQRNTRIAHESGFKGNPAEYDRRVIEISGKVVRILKDPFSEVIRRKFIDRFRTLTGDSNTEGRFIHQRFLISSPELVSGENLLILHNIKFGKLALKIGSSVRVKGEYLHQLGSSRGWFGMRRSLYGRVHYTHEPKGFVRII